MKLPKFCGPKQLPANLQKEVEEYFEGDIPSVQSWQLWCIQYLMRRELERQGYGACQFMEDVE